MVLNSFLKLVWRYLRHKKRKVVGAAVLSVVSAGLMAWAPKILGWLIDLATAPQPPQLELLVSLATGWLAVHLLALYLMREVRYRGARLGEYVFKSFMDELCEHYIRLPMAFHKREKSGEIISRFERASNYLLDIVEYLLFNLLPNLITAVVVLGLMFYVNLKITLLVLAVVGAYVYVTIKKSKFIARARNIVNKCYEKVSGTVHDVAKNIELVKGSASEEMEKEHINYYLERNYRKSDIFYRQFRSLRCWQENIQSTGLVLVLSVAVLLLFNKQITAGVFVVLFSYVRMVFSPFSQLANVYRYLQEAAVTINRAVEVWNEPIEDYHRGRKLTALKGDVEYRQVQFAYENGRMNVLKGVSFSVKAGQIVGVVGESGAGKTTLLGLLARFYQPDKGEILIDGYNIKDLDLTFLRQQIAIVPQEVSLFNDTLWNNLTYALPDVSKEKVIQALKAVNAWGFVQRFPDQLNQVVGERGMKLSTGQKQRIAIARALLNQQKIIILDEATSAQDSKSEAIVQRELFNLPGEHTIFIIAHRLSTIINADKILVIDKGGLAEQGTHAELMRQNGVYTKLVQQQNGI